MSKYTATYSATLDFLYSQLPMFQRQGAPALKKDLGNTIRLCEALNNPQNEFPAIHIAGTNGKGSVSHIIAAVLQAAGYKTGLYTSPHLHDFRERIKIDGEVISKKRVVDFVANIKPSLATIQPSFFELTVAMAFDYFAEQQVDVAVIETGLGGRLDSTNVVQPVLSVITNIGLDHQQFLGETLEEIAAEKAGIIKAACPVVIGEFQEKSWPIFAAKAAESKSEIRLASDCCILHPTKQAWDELHFDCSLLSFASEKITGLNSPLTAIYQQKNLRTAITALGQLHQLAKFPISDAALRTGLNEVKSRTAFRGRWDILQKEPKLILDGGHNLPGLQALFEQVSNVPHQKLHIVLGMVKDKELDVLLPLFEKKADYYFASPAVIRGLEATVLQKAAKTHGLLGKAYASVQEALEKALENASKDDLVLVCGSLYVIAEVPVSYFTG